MPDRPDYLDTGHNQELEEPRQRLLEDLSFKRRKTVDGNDSMSTSSRYFFTLSALLPSLRFLLVVIVGLTYKVLLLFPSLSVFSPEIRHPQFKISTSYIRDSVFIFFAKIS